MSTKHRVLVVDDSPNIHEDIRKILQRDDVSSTRELKRMSALLFDGPTTPAHPSLRHTFEIDSAFGGEEGVDKIQTSVRDDQPYMLAFVDVRMPPGLDGIATISSMWQLDPNLQVIVCTAYSDYSWEAAIAELGHSDGLLFLKKPFDEVEVLQGAHAMARKWWLQRAVNERVDNLEGMVKARTRELEARNALLEREISERQRVEEQFRYLATHDALTGLANRVLLYDRLRHAIDQAQRYKHPVGVTLIDLDAFKPVNDRFGHQVGDLLLRAVAQRLTELTRQSDTIARMGGDEFVAVLERLTDPAEAEVVAGRITEGLKRPFEIEGHTIEIAGSVGLAVYPEDAEDAETLLKGADAAMYRAKAEGRGRWDRCTNVWGTAKSSIGDDLSKALKGGGLRLAFQPVVGFESGEIMSMETLIRWSHPELGELSPSYFVRAAESSGLAKPLGDWLLETACATYREWLDEHIAPRAVAINISGSQLRRSDFVEAVKGALTRHGLAAGQLEIEVTESAALEDIDRSVDMLGQLKALGVRVVIDDFGAGISSIRRLKRLSVSAVKIDRFWTEHIATSPDDAAAIGAIIAMARSLGLEVVAEGIETSAQVAALHAIATVRTPPVTCDRLQGYLVGRPIKNETAKRLLRDSRRKPGFDELISLTADLQAE